MFQFSEPEVPSLLLFLFPDVLNNPIGFRAFSGSCQKIQSIETMDVYEREAAICTLRKITPPAHLLEQEKEKAKGRAYTYMVIWSLVMLISGIYGVWNRLQYTGPLPAGHEPMDHAPLPGE